MLIGLLTIGLHQATGEVLPRYASIPMPGLPISPSPATRPSTGWRARFRPSRRRQQLMALIITDRAEAVAERILQDMNRGATALSGTGMYTGKPHPVLMCALTITEVSQLKELVRAEDPDAFVIVVPTHEVLGRGFISLHEDE